MRLPLALLSLLVLISPTLAVLFSERKHGTLFLTNVKEQSRRGWRSNTQVCFRPDTERMVSIGGKSVEGGPNHLACFAQQMVSFTAGDAPTATIGNMKGLVFRPCFVDGTAQAAGCLAARCLARDEPQDCHPR